MTHSVPQWRFPTIALTVLTLLPSVAFAQEPARRTIRRPAEPPAAVVVEEMVSIDFAGGTIAEYVATLKENRPDLNIVLDPEAASVIMPPVSLRNVSDATALNVIAQTAAARESNIVVQNTRLQGQPDSGADVFIVTPVLPRQGMPVQPGGIPARNLRTGKSADRTFHVASLKEIIEGAPGEPGIMKPETVLTAIDTALGIQTPEGREKPVVKFHADSGLLIVQGSDEQVSTVQEVLAELKRTMRRPKPADEIGELRAALGALQKEIEKLRAEVQEGKKPANPPTPK